jgi:hypothetical protein
VITLPPLGPLDSDLWHALLDIAEQMPADWTLIGGQMVLLHGLEHGRTPPRLSQDLDLVIDARVRPPAFPAMIASLTRLGFEEAPIGFDEVAHRFIRGSSTVDVLAPDGLGPRARLETVGRATTVEVSGGTYALSRSRPVDVQAAGRVGVAHVPDLCGALVVKSAAVTRDRRRGPERHLVDLAFLYSLIVDPLTIREELGSKNRARLRAVEQLSDVQAEPWRLLDDEETIRTAHAAFALVTLPAG